MTPPEPPDAGHESIGAIGGRHIDSRDNAGPIENGRAAGGSSNPPKIPIEGVFPDGGGWRARILPFETASGAGPGNWVVDRVELEVWWLNGSTRRSYTLEGYRRSLLQPGDLQGAAE